MDDLGIMNTGVLLRGEYSIDIAEKEKLVTKVSFFSEFLLLKIEFLHVYGNPLFLYIYLQTFMTLASLYMDSNYKTYKIFFV